MKIYKKLYRDFTVCSNKIHKHNLSLQAIGLYLYILSKPDAWSFSYAGVSSQVKNGRDSIKNAVSELEQAKFLIRSRSKNKIGEFSDSVWFVTDEPFKSEVFQSTANQLQESPLVDKNQEVNKKKRKKEKVKADFSSIERAIAPPSLPITKEAINPDLTNLLRRKKERRAKKNKIGGFSNNLQLNRESGLEISLRDNVDNKVIDNLSKKHGISKEEVQECKNNYIAWILGSSFNSKVWGKDMFIYVDRFCSQKASKPTKKEKPNNLFDEIEAIYGDN